MVRITYNEQDIRSFKHYQDASRFFEAVGRFAIGFGLGAVIYRLFF